MSDWHETWEAAQKEACAARLQWKAAETAMARANARRNCADRQLDRLFREEMDAIRRLGAERP